MTGTAPDVPDTTPRADGSVPIVLTHDRLLVSVADSAGERQSSGGILIPATAQVARRLSWARVVAHGPSVRMVQVGDRVLFEPQDRANVELQGIEYVLLRERDVHAVAASRVSDAGTGLYL
ncbi:MAG: co-chaperone GroES [Actinomycetota bacterium]|nr:MAG: co-chaperone GroES [Actinomycetota bacterium]